MSDLDELLLGHDDVPAWPVPEDAAADAPVPEPVPSAAR